MKMSGGPASLNIKIALLAAAALIAAGTLIYTQALVKRLQQRERQTVELFAAGIKQAANTNNAEDLTFLFENIIKPIDFPLILTDANDDINIGSKTDIKNIDMDSNLTLAKQKEYLTKKLKDMDLIHEPISVTYNDTIVLQRIHYGNSALVNQLKYYPYIQILIATLFILLGYVGFSSIKKSEQSNIWVGMAKETAHQFGTPLSSLLGWIEMLKISYSDPVKVTDITSEIENDVERLNKITTRFSKIGAIPELKPRNVFEEIKKVTDYFQRRIPQSGKTVELIVKGDLNASANLNSELFSWVIENLTKNALDAIENKRGSITYLIKETKNAIDIEVTDTGKGIEMKRRKDVFRPGYSTKRRGWGLGLSLSKRIIEGYHKGKIYVKHSSPGEGTTFKILLEKC